MTKTMELYKVLGLKDSEHEEIVRRLGREPNELETYLFSAMWSEHCGYMHSKKYLSQFPSGGAVTHGENAGGVQIGEHVVVFKMESHNHPSAVEPFQGAATGIGGIVRDILAVGARPIALLDSLKFGKVTESFSKHIFDGVVRGISHYGNCIGVPTVAGEVGFDESYADSPLVNVMCAGIVHKDDIRSAKAEAGKTVIVVGSHTGRDGIHGASFASKELDENSKEDRPSVQIGDAFMKKVLIEATLEILNLKEVQSCQDFGAAGLLSSSSEMVYKGKCGIDLHLDKVHLREEGMLPWEIMLSESQERMLFVVDDIGAQKVLDIAAKYDIPASVIGKTTNSKQYRLFWQGKEVANVPPELLAEAPEYELNEEEPEYINEYKQKSFACHCEERSDVAIHKSISMMDCHVGTPTPPTARQVPPRNDKTKSLEEAVEKILSDPNFASKRWVYSQYDHTVGARTSVKPGEVGAAGIWVHEEGSVVGFTIDSNGRQVFLNPYEGSRNTVWEAYRNLVSGGFEPLGITDCLNFGNPEKDEVAYQFVNSVNGIADACKEIGIPVVSGNVSFYNESPQRRVFPTPAIGMAGVAASHQKLIRVSFKQNETLFLIGKEITEDSKIGGSLYQRVLYDFIGGEVDFACVEFENRLKEVIFSLRDNDFLGGCQDVSEGGLLGAVFEGVWAGKTGFAGNLIDIKNKEKALFGEVTGRYVISTSQPEKTEEFLASTKIPYKKLGKCKDGKFTFNDYNLDLGRLYDLYDKSIDLEMNK